MAVCIVLHGFTGSPEEIRPLADALAREGYSVLTPVLAGHGGGRKALGQVTWNDWIEGVEAIVRPLVARGETVHLIGFSMGGLIGIHLAAAYPVSTLVTLSAPVYTIHFRPWVRKIFHELRRFRDLPAASPDFRRYLVKLRETPLRSVIHFRRLVYATRKQLPAVKTPILVIQGMRDELVRPKSAQYILQSVSSETKRLRLFPRSEHLICLGEESPQVCEEVIDFLLRCGKET